MKKFTIVIISALTLFTCSNQKRVESSISKEMINDQGQEHTCQCPIHPEVPGNEGDTCTKYGMKLEHSADVISAAGNYFEVYD